MITAEFVFTSLVVALIPGTGVLFTISVGLAQGRRAALFAALGCTAGIIPHLLATVLGLAALMHTSALAFQALKVAGAAYLFYLAFVTWKDRQGFALAAQVPARTAAALILRAIALNLLNPKLTLFFLAFLPQFMSTAYAPGAQLMVLSGVFMAATFVVFLAYGLAAHALRGAVLSSPRVQDWLRRSFAAAFAALGARLAIADR